MDRLEGLTVRDLRSLLVLAEVKSFTRAAERLDLSQPSLSTIVKKAEGAFGQPLFLRTSRRCEVAPEAVTALHEIRIAMEHLEHAVQGDMRTGPFRIGFIPTIGPYLWPRVSWKIRDAMPSLQIRLAEATTPRLIRMLLDGRLDVALVSLPIDERKVTVTHLFEEDLLLAVPTGVAASTGEVEIADLDPKQLLLLEHGHCLRDQIISTCGANEEQSQTIHATSLQTVLHMVQAGAGYTIVPEMATRPENAPNGITYRRFSSPPRRTIGLAAAPWTRRKSVVDALIGLLK